MELKVIREPSVILAGSQVFNSHGWYNFVTEELGKHPDDFYRPDGGESCAEMLCEWAGRLCYMSFGKGRKTNAEYLANIIESGHGSVLEHACWNFVITGVSRTFSHELVRHRAGFAYSQLSQRYVDESVAEYVEPDVIANDPELHQVWESAVSFSHQAYCSLAEKLYDRIAREEYMRDYTSFDSSRTEMPEPSPERLKVWKEMLPQGVRTELRKRARQAARSVLPNATETKVFVTANARSWRHFIEMRASRHAEVEIRKVAVKVYDILVKEAPALFSDYKKEELPDGTFELTTKHRKV